MLTAKIKVKPHIAEYCYGKYSNCTDAPVRFPHITEIYHTVWDHLSKRPANAPADVGNLEIILPNSRMEDEKGFTKNPRVFNYLSKRSAKAIERRIENFMFAEIHDLLQFNKKTFGQTYKDTVYEFMRRYNIYSATEDMYIKNYYRYRRRLSKYDKKRSLF